MSVVRLPVPLLRQIAGAAEAAYPRECCGLIAGTGDTEAGIDVTRAVVAANVHPDGGHDRFEVDPQARFDLMRELGEIGGRPPSAERLVGHYHSHPDHLATPSATDLACAFEPNLVWLIVGVDGGAATAVTAHLLDADAGRFRQIPLRRPDGGPHDIAPDPGPATA